MSRKWKFWKRSDPHDFSNYLPKGAESVKEKLIAECRRRGVSVYVNDTSEPSSGVFTSLRAIASEAELQNRLVGVVSLEVAAKANRVAWLALLVGLGGLVVAVAT